MFKRAISVVLQAMLLLAVFGAGSFLPVFHLLPMWRVAAGANHYFVLDGLLLMLLLYLCILAIEAGRKRLTSSGGLTTLALARALLLGLAMKFGLMDRPGAV